VHTRDFTDEASYLRNLVAEEKLLYLAASEALALTYPIDRNPAALTRDWHHSTSLLEICDRSASDAAQSEPLITGSILLGGAGYNTWQPTSSSATCEHLNSTKQADTLRARSDRHQPQFSGSWQLSEGQRLDAAVDAGWKVQHNGCAREGKAQHHEAGEASGEASPRDHSSQERDSRLMGVATPPQSWEPQLLHLSSCALPVPSVSVPVVEDKM